MTVPSPPVFPADVIPDQDPFYFGIQQVAPPWMQDEDSIRYLFTVGAQIDCSQEYLRLGICQRWPSAMDRAGNPIARPESVAAVGRDRQIARGQYEPDGSYRERVRVARTTWSRAGNAQTLLRQLRAYYLPDPPMIRYVVNGVTAGGTPFADWMTISGGTDEVGGGVITRHRSQPNNWDWDGTTGHVRFWIIVYSGLTPWFWGATPVGSGLNWAQGQSWGFVESATWLRDVRQIISKWKAAGSHAGVISQAFDGGIIAALDDLAFDPAYPPGGVPGYPMPTGDWNVYANRPDGQPPNPLNGVFLSGV